ncbi:MAG: stage V sporulation protein S [bacterium]|nr:stage V sporulation protein S [Coprothermobacterota bacterium]
MTIMKVAATSNPRAVAGAVANTVREAQHADLQAIGPKAVNQAIKAIAIARGYVASNGIDLICVPIFVEVEIDGSPRSAIKFMIEPR